MARLSAKALVNFQSVNSFQYANQWIVRAGDASTLYFQLVDLDQVSNSLNALPAGAQINSVFGSSGLRYIAGIGGSLQPVVMQVTFPSIDSAKTIVLTATQNTNDGSIFSVSIPSTSLPSGGNVIFKLSEGSGSRSFGVLNLLAVEYPGADGCDGSLPNAGF